MRFRVVCLLLTTSGEVVSVIPTGNLYNLDIPNNRKVFYMVVRIVQLLVSLRTGGLPNQETYT